MKTGLVASLNRPGGNVTGTSYYTAGLGTKRLELLHELVPRASVIAVLVKTGNPTTEEQLSNLQQAANALRLRLILLAVTGDTDLEPAFAKVALEGAGALYVTASAFFTSRGDKLAGLAAQHRIPAIYPRQEPVAAGGLISYQPTWRSPIAVRGYTPASFSRGRSRPSCRSSCRPISSWSSILRPRTRSA